MPTFIGVKELRICNSLMEELSRVLEVDELVSDPGLLPGLREVFGFDGMRQGLFNSFTHARGVVAAGHPVRVGLEHPPALASIDSTYHPAHMQSQLPPAVSSRSEREGLLGFALHLNNPVSSGTLPYPIVPHNRPDVPLMIHPHTYGQYYPGYPPNGHRLPYFKPPSAGVNSIREDHAYGREGFTDSSMFCSPNALSLTG